MPLEILHVSRHKDSVPYLLQLLVASGVPQLMATSLLLSSRSLLFCVSLIRTLGILRIRGLGHESVSVFWGLPFSPLQYLKS